MSFNTFHRTNRRIWYHGPRIIDDCIINAVCPTLVTADETGFTVDSACRVISYNGQTITTSFSADSTTVDASSLLTVDGV
jgi:hypothetical protein